MTEEFPHYIEFRHVYKAFDRPVLIDCNFHVENGETVAIIGRSGVGKSVTLGHIMGFLKPDSGRVIVAHEDITDYPESERQKYLKRVPLGRAGTPQDVADTVHFLCTAGNYITGQVIRLDGGRSIT